MHWIDRTFVTLSLVLLSAAPPSPAAERAEPRAVAPRPQLTAAEQQTIDVFQAAAPSVVYISTSRVRRDIFSRNIYEIPQGAGTGFIWDDQGHIVTNFHVLEGAQVARVTLNDQSSWDAKPVGVAPDKDLAVLKIEAPAARLQPIPIGTSSDLLVGQHVLAIGNPFGLDQSLSTGVISGLGREIQSLTRRPIHDVIQTDAAINPGNSGGPLLDSAGRLIGVNTMIYSRSGTYAGVGFAVPVDTVNRFVPQLVRFGRVRRPGIGVNIADDQLAKRLGVPGVLVLEVIPGGPADAAGISGVTIDRRRDLHLGDVIIAVADTPVTKGDDLFTAFDALEVGDEVELTLSRDGKAVRVKVKLYDVE